jgi:anthranilate phosphoribosyltransferase
MVLKLIAKVESGSGLTRAESELVMEQLLDGRLEEAHIVRLLLGLREKGETVEELVGFARAIRSHAEPVFATTSRPDGVILDTCGTGGDASGVFNVSTAVALVAAGAGVRVAKHGNRSISSKSGSADVFEALGISLETSPARAGEAIANVGIGFLFAPAVHKAVRHAMTARRQIGARTVFNLLGPLTNPAGATAQLAGVFSEDVIEKVAQALAELGVERAFVVHGLDGLDEISLSAKTAVAEVKNGSVRTYRIGPQDFGLSPESREALLGGDPQANAQILRALLSGEKGAKRNLVLANTSAALVASGAASDFRDGVRLAAQAIDSGAARAKLDALIAFLRS